MRFYSDGITSLVIYSKQTREYEFLVGWDQFYGHL
jgi:hypothetical protein